MHTYTCIHITYSRSHLLILVRPADFYLAVGLPALAAGPLALALASLPILRLSRPERAAVSVECLIQVKHVCVCVCVCVCV